MTRDTVLEEIAKGLDHDSDLVSGKITWVPGHDKIMEALRLAYAEGEKASESRIERLKRENIDLNRRLGKPRCITCNRVNMTNCAHFDECDGVWEYELESRVSRLEGALREANEELAKWRERGGFRVRKI